MSEDYEIPKIVEEALDLRLEKMEKYKQLTEAHDGLVDNLNDIFEAIDKRFAALEEKLQINEELTEVMAATLFVSLGSDLPQEKLDELLRRAEASGAILPDLVTDFITRNKPRH